MVKFIPSGADCYLHERPAGGWYFQNPCEKTMSTGSLALQHVTLQRESMDDEFEAIMKKSTCVIRETLEENEGFEKSFIVSIEKPIDGLNEMFGKLRTKGIQWLQKRITRKRFF